MKITETNIIVCCPHLVTGGPELLHQLVHELRECRRSATIAYYPFSSAFTCPEAYVKYSAPQGHLVDEDDTFILLPESLTGVARYINNAKVGIWWLSVDNYYYANKKSILRDFYYRYKSLLGLRMPLCRMKKFTHFAQSEYARKYLEKHKISSIMLTDYLGSEHIENSNNLARHDKECIIAYNPSKGYVETRRLMNAYPNMSFEPIQNMTSTQVSNLLGRAKIYIDFGHHPGKDRLPREAAIAGCCVITGRKGAARFYEDLPIPNIYKLDDSSPSYVGEFGFLVEKIFSDYEIHSKNFDDYRAKINKEYGLFKQQVRDIFT